MANEDEDDLGWYEEVDDFPKGTPIVERTTTRGDIELDVPIVGGGHARFRIPATNRSAMIILCCLFCCVTLIVALGLTVTIWLIASGDPENISRLTSVLGRDDSKPEEFQAPERVPVKTDDGIEIIEVCRCPPPDCDEECPCDCAVPVPCPAKVMAPPPLLEKAEPLPQITR